MKTILALWIIVLGLALVGQLLAITQKFNVYDTLPTRCGRGLKEVCPPSGINWEAQR